MTPTAKTKRLIENYYAAFNRGDMQAFLGMLDDDVVHEINQGGKEVGKQSFARFMDKMNSHYREQVADLVVMASDDGRRAAAEFMIQGVYLKTDDGLPEARGQEYTLPVGAFFEVDGDKISRVTNYYNLNLWLGLVK
jgi:steroid delta-isomerase-like uncharacterized protein